MAKIKFGMMMTDARGKLGGQVFSKNKAGAYIRTKVTPTNPRTAKQMTSRSILGTLSAGWNALTLDQVSAWNKAVPQWAKTDIFGDLKNPTGKNLFVSLNKNILGINRNVINMPPDKIEMENISSFEAWVNDLGTASVFTGLPSLTAGAYQVMASPTVPTGVNYVKNRLRVIVSGDSENSLSEDFIESYTATFGEAPKGGKCFIQVRQIGINGQAGVPIMVRLGLRVI